MKRLTRLLMGSRRGINSFSLSGFLMSLRTAILLLVADMIFGMAGFMILENYNLPEAFYMVVITLSTVGFGEIRPMTLPGRVFTSFFILINIGLFAYFLAVFTYFVIQGEIFKLMYNKFISDSIDQLQDHIIICGYGRYGREITQHFLKHDLDFVIIDQDLARIEMLQKAEERILYIHDDATHDEALLKAGLKRARGLIAALPEDSDNLFIILTARQLNAQIRLISRAKDPRSEKKLLLAGANHVVMPEQIGGFYMATLINKPRTVEFFSFISNEYRTDIGFEEISYEHIPEVCRGKTIRELSIRKHTGANIIGFRDARGDYHINPDPDTVLEPQTSFIILGDKQQIQNLHTYIASLANGEQVG